MRTTKTLVRLRGCPGWSKSSLGAQPFCWFCHMAARVWKISNRTVLRSLFSWHSWNAFLSPVKIGLNSLKMSRLMTKQTKWHVRPAKTQISLSIRPVWSVFTVRMKKAWILSYPLSAQQRLIRLIRCPGWSSFRWGHMPFCWFCHEAAQIYYPWQHSWLQKSGTH